MISVDGFTEQAQQAITRANAEARDYRHQYVGTEHVLLALLTQGDGISCYVLGRFGITPCQVREEIEKLVCPGPENSSVPRPLTPRTLEAVEFARQEALYSCRGLVDSEHLLLGLLQEPDGVAGVVLRNLGVDFATAREEVLKIRFLQMKIVERAVRPVRATVDRKMRMREELLAHLTEIYNEERAAECDAVRATELAANRFGDPMALAQELQATVPWYDRLEAMFHDWFGWRPPETVARWMLRQTAYQAALALALCGAALLINTLVVGWDRVTWTTIRILAALVIVTPAVTFIGGTTYYKLRNSLFGVFGARKSRLAALGYTTVLALLISAAGLGFVTIIHSDVRQFAKVQSLPGWFGIAITVAVGAMLLARLTGAREIRQATWALLDLEQ